MKKILDFVSKVIKSKFTKKEELGQWYKDRVSRQGWAARRPAQS